jgi:sortase (surface protein transpeptidase)
VRGRTGGLILAVLAVVLLAAGFGLGGGFGTGESDMAAVPSPIASERPSPTPSPVPVVPRQLPPTPVIPEDLPTPEPTPTPTPDVAKGPTNRVATRVVVPDLGIDLPVTRQKSSYPSCDVAMYLTRFDQPGQGGPVYLYAHAQRGMFLELLEQSLRRNGNAMLGMEIHVYTGDNLKFRYEITQVRRHVRDFRYVQAARGETVWLQTSEGPNASYPKLQVAGELVGRKHVGHDEAHPKPHPRNC